MLFRSADTDLRFAFRKGLEEVWAQGDAQLETAMRKGREYMTEATIEKMKLFGSVGKYPVSDLFSIDPSRKW